MEPFMELSDRGDREVNLGVFRTTALYRGTGRARGLSFSAVTRPSRQAALRMLKLLARPHA